MHSKSLASSLLILLGTTAAHAQFNTWASAPDKPTAVTHSAGVGLNGFLYVVGGSVSGSNNTAVVEAFDSAVGTWTTETTAPLALSEHAVARSGGKLYVAGGRTTPTGSAVGDLNIYDFSAKTWTGGAAIPTPRFGACAAYDGGTFFLIGGDTGSGATSAVEAYTTLSDSWAPVLNMPTARRGAAAAIAGTRIFVVGGENVSGVLATLEAYDLNSGKWTTRAPLPSARTEASAVVLGGVLYVIGGFNTASQATSTVFMYDYTTDQWLRAANLPGVSGGGSAGKVAGGLALAGGAGITSALSRYTAGPVHFVVGEPGIDSPDKPTGATFASFGNPIVNVNGHYAYKASLALSGGVTAADNLGIWADHDSGRAKLIARSGSPAPGTTSAVFASFSDPVFDNNDKVAFQAKLRVGTGDATTANVSGIWSDASGGGILKLVARLNAHAPGTPNGTVFAAFTSLVLPDSGGAVFIAKLRGPGVTTSNDVGLWADDGNGVVNLVAREGSSILVNGVTKVLSAMAIFPAATGVTGQSRGFNINGDLVYRATFTDHSKALLHAVAP